MDYIFPIHKEEYVIYTKTGCLYCDKAKELLKNEKVAFVNCDEYLKDNKQGFLDFIKLVSGGITQNTFPMVFHKGFLIGGYTETKTFYENQNAFSFFDDK